MKLTSIFILITCLQVSAESYSQQVTLSERNAPMEKVFKSIRAQTGYVFFYDAAILKDVSPVTVDIKNASLEEALKTCFKDQPLSYYLIGKTIVVDYKSSKPESKPDTEKQSLIDVKGTVVNESGEPLAGVTVLVNGSKTGTRTNQKGEYALFKIDAESVLVFSSIGYLSKEEAVNNRTIVNVRLSISISALETIEINTGYQEIAKDRMAGSSFTLTAKDIENNSFKSIDAILDGKVTGLYSAPVSGAPGARSEIRIRGDNSISGNREPLWIVDGLPMQSGVASLEGLTSGNIQQSILDHGIGSIIASDIESVTILKDATATAIYGAKAANGVIVITTKRGRNEPLSVSYQGAYGITAAPAMAAYNFMNASQKVAHEIELMEDFNVGGGVGRAGLAWEEWQKGKISTDQYNNILADLSNVDVNWFDQIYRTGFSHDHSLSVKGGNQKYWFYTSLNLTDEKGALFTNQFNRIGSNINIGFRPKKDLTIDFRLSGSYRSTKDNASAINPFSYAVFANPYEKPYEENGSYAWDNSFIKGNKSVLSEGYKFPYFNILNEMRNTYREDIASDLNTTLNLNWKITKNLKAEAIGRVGYSTLASETAADVNTYSSYINYYSLIPFRTGTGPSSSELPLEYNKGYLNSTFGRSPSYSIRANMSYNQTLHEKHYFSVFAGSEITSKKTWNKAFRTAQYDMEYNFAGFPEYSWAFYFNPGGTNVNMGQDIAKMSRHIYGGNDRSASFFSSFVYSYDNRYVINANTRFDGASTIDPKNRFVPLGSVGTRWNIHNEKFVQDNLPFISGLAIRAVYGFTGNIDQRALPYPYILLAPQQYDNEYQAREIFFPNPSIKWEKKRDRNIGIDYSFFNNVIGGSFNYYNNVTNNILGKTNAPNSSLNTSPIMNSHTITNSGTEFIINLRIRMRDLLWISQFNISHNKNKITESTFPSIEDFNDTRMVNYWAGYSGPVEGYENGATFGYHFAGVDQLTGDALIYLSEKARAIYAKAKGMDIKEVPMTWNPSVNPSITGVDINKWLMYSMDIIGHSQPKYTGGFSSTFNYKGIELRGEFSYATGFSIRSFDERKNSYVPGGSNSELGASRLNRLVSAQNRWKSPGDVTDYPRYSTSDSRYLMMNTDNRFEEGDFLNFQNLYLSYGLKPATTKFLGLQSCRIGFQAQNLFIWTRATATDITTRNAFGYPRTRKYLFNIRVSF